MYETKLEVLAKRRVYSDPRLDQYESIIFYDWPNWEEHLEWVRSAPIEEIIDWAEGIRRDCYRAEGGDRDD